MNPPQRACLGLLLLAVMAALATALVKHGTYGLTVFVVTPILLGALASWIARPATGMQAAGWGACGAALATCSLLAFGLEGVVCIAMALPLTTPWGAMGGWFLYELNSMRTATIGVGMVLLLPPVSLTWDLNATPAVFTVRSAIEISASPEQVWKHVVSFSELPEPTEWLFRLGIAYPQRARIVGSGAGAVRYCEFSTGPFVEPIEIWNEPQLLRFRVTSNPAPMTEWSPTGTYRPNTCTGIWCQKEVSFY